DPVANGWDKAEYRPGDIRDPEAVAALVDGADVVVHLAFIIVDDGDEGAGINRLGSRNVFEAAGGAGAERLVYTSPAAAHGFHRGLPDLITENEPARGTSRHPYSADKAEVEADLEEVLDGAEIEAYVFRPCIVAGPEATLLLDMVPLLALGQK